jgi:tripartite-type tricarboxylate transporter receptor subunit TctC
MQGVMMSRLISWLCVAITAVFTWSHAAAQDFPSRPIVMVIPFPPGGSTDVLGRVLGVSLGNELKQPVVVENVGGAGGTIGAAKAARAAPNGYTILFHNMAHSTAPALYRKLPYDPVGDFDAIGLVTDVPMILVGRKDLPPESLKDLIAYIKTEKQNAKFANAGIGATSHLCGLLLISALEADVTSVSYKGTGPALNDLMGGQVDLLCDQPASTMGFIKSGRIKPYAVATRTRLGSLPDVPTFAEGGVKEFELAVWHGLYASKGTPKPILDKLHSALQQALKDPALVKRFEEIGAEPVSQDRATPQALQSHVESEVARWGPIIKRAGVQAE